MSGHGYCNKQRMDMLSEFSELTLEVSNLTHYLRLYPTQTEKDKATVKATFKRCQKRLKELENAYNDIYVASDSKSAAV